MLVTHPPNLRYLAGFQGSTGALLITPDSGTLIVDGRYLTAAREQVARTSSLPLLTVALADPDQDGAIAEVARSIPGLGRLGVEGAAMSLSQYARLTERLEASKAEVADGIRTVSLIPVERVVERARLIKDEAEIHTLRQAAAMLSDVAREALSFVEAGEEEREVAMRIEAALRRGGFERPAFDTIVASGPNSALPHARPGSRRLEPGDGVVLDFGGVYDGYSVDLTRTVQLPPLTDAFEGMFEAVRAARAAAIAAVRPGVRARDVDAAARNVLTQHGLGAAFVHGTGHGLGLEVHEEPRISSAPTPAADEVLQPGMVFTIEPGVYVAGLGGVRLEDDVLVVEAGCVVLTDVPIDRTGPGHAGSRPLLAGD